MSAPSNWIPADKELPGNVRRVLATDGEAHFVAYFQNEGRQKGQWINEHWETGYDEIESVVTHWMELPEVPE